MNKYLILSFFSLATLSGCASIISGATDSVVFTATPENVAFSIKDEEGKPVHKGTTPATVVLKRSDGFFDGQTYQVDFSAPGYSPKTLPLDTTLNGWYVGNLLFGGALGILIVDPATGAMWDLPGEVNVTLPKMQTQPK